MFHMWVMPCSTSPFVFCLFHITQCPPAPSMFHKNRFHPSYGWLAFHSVYVPHSVSHSSVDGYYRFFFHFLASVHIATINIGVWKSFWQTSFISLGYTPNDVLLDQLEVLVFGKTSLLLTTMAMLIYIPINGFHGDSLSTSFPTLIFFHLFGRKQ